MRFILRNKIRLIMKNLMIFLIWIVTMNLFAQGENKGQFTTKGEFDPAARQILDKLKKKYDTYKALEVDVNVEIEIPESDKQVMKGKMVQSGDKYRMEMGDNLIISDGTDIWTVLKDAEEVQLTDRETYEEDGDNIMMSPKDLMSIYEKGEYVYALTNEQPIKGKMVQQIEFKPIDPESEYFKIRINVNKKEQMISSMKIFAKDGSRYTLSIDDLQSNKIYESSYFRYSDNDCKGCRVEDLRF